MNEITFLVVGVPVQQGSKTPWGTEQNPHVKSWRQSIAERALEALHDGPPLAGPVRVEAIFVFPRPKVHFGKGKNAERVRDDAPYYHTNYPDLDKLQRAVGDALAGVVVRDDRQIVHWDVRKIYGPRAGVRLTVYPLPRATRNGA